ncbi:type II toxin-antitoxin system toxin DNA ADP-ribosyl transferase DarT [Ferrimonas aestuarii]|uniref:DUF4433 domain-containing protein n=1 Tax=Ferrimonas aestuarii TaxID=2569539 RepID=A0A4U1BQ31_9GAMM|nr:DarT ssDNA thymidine ADP-ribosyltransferase family protein [Ferrimonas aestuarii]TKB53077.1 DUF4433 domain-containing protein [Ferrimonas aestuarii]
MTVPTELAERYAYHFTSIDNIASIIQNGLLCTSEKARQGIVHINVAEEGIQKRRSEMEVTCNPGGCVHDYVPFYFAKKTPMLLAVINKRNVDQDELVYLAIPITILTSREDAVFTDASANTEVPPNFYNSENLEQLTTLNWPIIDSRKWTYPPAETNQKMAELLVKQSVSLADVSHFIVQSQEIANQLFKIFRDLGVGAPKVFINSDHYFDWSGRLIGVGPKRLKRELDEAITDVCKAPPATTPKFVSVRDALDKLGADFNLIKELSDIDGLMANYPPHNCDVGEHTRKVVNGLDGIAEYQELSDELKDIVKLAAYFHDIGKGPKERWPKHVMSKPDHNHVFSSLKMARRILKEEFVKLDDQTVSLVLMLIAYDDLLGDICGNGRDEKQLFDTVKSKTQLKMLIALSTADVSSICFFWSAQLDAFISRSKEEWMQRLP